MNTSGGTTTDKFDYLGVKSCMDSLDNKFAEFAELLRTVNDYMNENISVDHHSAIFGILGDKYLADWNENASTFGDFYENFSVWSQLMVNIMNQYGGFDNAAVKNAIGQNQASGATLAGVAETRAAIWENNQLKDFQDANLIGKSNKIVEEGVVGTQDLGNGLVQYTYIDGTVVTYDKAGDGSVERMIVENVDGTIQGRTFIDDGGCVVEHYDATGKAVSSDIINPEGVVVATRTYAEDYRNDTMTFYNADGSKDTVKIYEDVMWHGDGMKSVTTTDMLLNSDKLISSGPYYGVNGKVNTTSELVYMNKVGAIDNNYMHNGGDWFAGERTAAELGMHNVNGNFDSEWRHEGIERLNDNNSTAVTDQAIIRQNIASRDGQVAAVEAHNIDDVKAYYRDDAASQNYDYPTAAFQDGSSTGYRPSGADGNVTSGNTVLYNSGYNTTMPQTQSEDNVVVSPNTPVAPGYVPNQKDDDVRVTPLPTTPGNNGNVTPLPYVPSDNEAQVVYLGGTNTPVVIDSDRVVSL